jgi:hypothetical protein
MITDKRSVIDLSEAFGCSIAEPRLSEADPHAVQSYSESRQKILSSVKRALDLRKEVRAALEKAHEEQPHLRLYALRRLLERLLNKFSEVERNVLHALRLMIDALPDDELGFPSLESLSNFIPLMRFARITVPDFETLLGIPGRQAASASSALERGVFSDPRGSCSEPETLTYADRVIDELRKLVMEEGLECLE